MGFKRPNSIETGASNSSFELGGRPLTRLVVKKRAGRCAFDFSAPNPEEMAEIDVDAGAGHRRQRGPGRLESKGYLR
ncbi:MAG: hypothetical protein ACYDGS_09905 [Thermoleophilia bacterium]